MTALPIFERPRPWQRRTPGQCVRCEQPDEFLISSARTTVKFVRKSLGHLATSEILYTLSCAAHRESLMDEYVERFGFTCSEPTSPISWRYWISSFYWRPANRIRERIQHGPRLAP